MSTFASVTRASEHKARMKVFFAATLIILVPFVGTKTEAQDVVRPTTAYCKKDSDRNIYVDGGIVRGNPLRKRIALVFTAALWADGADTITSTLKSRGVKGNFFFTGKFYEKYPHIVKRLVKEKHYVGSHGYGHLLYSPWDNRDSTLVSRKEFNDDMAKSYALMAKAGIKKRHARYFIPSYEHYNKTISAWAREQGLQVINYTPGTRSNADYTTPDMKSYAGSEELYSRLVEYESRNTLNGHFLLLHFGTHPARTDKFYNLLPRIIDEMKKRGYVFVTVNEMIER